jgi:IS5 family transposase
MPKRTKPTPRQKPVYHLSNWADYEPALVQRGSLTFWLTDDFEQAWLYTGAKQRGSQFAYSDRAIEIMLTLKEVFGLTNRGVEGMVSSLFALLGLALPVPDHSTLCRRSQAITVTLPRRQHQRLDLVLDSTGLKVYGAGEWHVRQHGASRRRTWRKLHLGINPDDGEIQAALMTDNQVSDGEAVGDLLPQIPSQLDTATADGAYDTRTVYDLLNAHSPGVNIVTPPRRGARLWQHGNARAERLKRDDNVRAIRRVGRQAWQRQSGYHQRSLVETTMYRLKTIFGQHLSTRLFETQNTQTLIRCAALNRMTQLGMPQSYLVA